MEIVLIVPWSINFMVGYASKRLLGVRDTLQQENAENVVKTMKLFKVFAFLILFWTLDVIPLLFYLN